MIFEILFNKIKMMEILAGALTSIKVVHKVKSRVREYVFTFIDCFIIITYKADLKWNPFC